MVIKNIYTSLIASLMAWARKNVVFLIANCKNSLENYKSFVMKIINRKNKQGTTINKK